MKYYGLSKERRDEYIRYIVSQKKNYISAHLEPNKEKRKRKIEFYEDIFQKRYRFRDDQNNSIPEGKYYTPFSFITTDLVAKENITFLKKGLERLASNNMSHKFLGGLIENDDLNKTMDNINKNLSSWDVL